MIRSGKECPAASPVRIVSINSNSWVHLLALALTFGSGGCAESVNESTSIAPATPAPDAGVLPAADADPVLGCEDHPGAAADLDAGRVECLIASGDSGAEDAGHEADSGHSGNFRDAAADKGAADSGAADSGNLMKTCEASALPEEFLLRGCGVETPCQILQDSSCQSLLYCAQQFPEVVALGESARESQRVSFKSTTGASCELIVEAGEVSGECEGELFPCSLALSKTVPHPACVELGATLGDVRLSREGKASPLELGDCSVLQHGCDIQGLCDDTPFTGQIFGEQLEIRLLNLECTLGLNGAQSTGECGGPAGETAEVQLVATTAPAGACEVSVPEHGFILQGCTRTGKICHMAQRGCVWAVACGEETYSGRAEGTNEFNFISDLGASCDGTSEEGLFSGHCVWSNEECSFSGAAAVPAETCQPVPPTLRLEHCGEELDCVATQHGCRWQLSCGQGSRIFGGESSADMLSVALQDGTQCPLLQTDGVWRAQCSSACEGAAASSGP